MDEANTTRKHMYPARFFPASFFGSAKRKPLVVQQNIRNAKGKWMHSVTTTENAI